MTRNLIFVNLFEVNINLHKILAHVELRSVRSEIFTLLRLLLRHLSVYNVILRPLGLLENIIIFKCLCPVINVLSYHIIYHQVSLLFLCLSNGFALNLRHLRDRRLWGDLNEWSWICHRLLHLVLLLTKFLLQCFQFLNFVHFKLLKMLL